MLKKPCDIYFSNSVNMIQVKKQCPFPRVFIPDENLVWCPENLMTAILAQVHYLPDNWRGNAHTTRVRNEMSQLFQYKAVSLLANTSQFGVCCSTIRTLGCIFSAPTLKEKQYVGYTDEIDHNKQCIQWIRFVPFGSNAASVM